MSGVLVNRETRAVGRKLEQHAARLPEIHRLEPEPIDDGRGLRACTLDLAAHSLLMRFVIHAPREMVDAAHSPGARPCIWCLPQIDNAGCAGKSVSRPLAI